MTLLLLSTVLLSVLTGQPWFLLGLGAMVLAAGLRATR
jgi:hypothetical protein